jgi:uncharacterized membrane protein YedE/YeeE
MDWAAFSPVASISGGVMIAVAAAMVLALNGKIAGISGLVARVLRPVAGDVAWRVAFLAGMVAGGAAVFAAEPRAAAYVPSTGTAGMAVAGFLVGLGTRLAGGCTSGHGVCGIARGSRRAMAATGIFMGVAALTVLLRRWLP